MGSHLAKNDKTRGIGHLFLSQSSTPGHPHAKLRSLTSSRSMLVRNHSFLSLLAAICCLIVYEASLMPSEAEAINDNTSLQKYESILQCGPNALFMFLLLNGKSEVDIDSLQGIPISPQGASMLDLRNAARDHGMEVEIRHYSKEDIYSIPLPAVCQFTNRSDASITRMHFDLLYKVDKTFLYVLSGTTGAKERIRLTKLPEYWTGNAMIRTQSRLDRCLDTLWRRAFTPLLSLDVLILCFFIHKTLLNTGKEGSASPTKS